MPLRRGVGPFIFPADVEVQNLSESRVLIEQVRQIDHSVRSRLIRMFAPQRNTSHLLLSSRTGSSPPKTWVQT